MWNFRRNQSFLAFTNRVGYGIGVDGVVAAQGGGDNFDSQASPCAAVAADEYGPLTIPGVSGGRLLIIEPAAVSSPAPDITPNNADGARDATWSDSVEVNVVE